MKIRPVWAELFRPDGQRDMTKLIVAFRGFANVPKTLRIHGCHKTSFERVTLSKWCGVCSAAKWGLSDAAVRYESLSRDRVLYLNPPVAKNAARMRLEWRYKMQYAN
jgi:hypothetical protein